MRGSDVHSAIHFDAEGDLLPSSISDMVRPYFDAYKRFERETQWVSLLAETPLAHPVLGYAGKLDRLGWKHGEGKLTLLDFKTGVYCPHFDMQLVAYLDLIIANREELGIDALDLHDVDLLIVELRKTGTYKIRPMTLTRHLARAYFHAALMLTAFMESK